MDTVTLCSLLERFEEYKRCDETATTVPTNESEQNRLTLRVRTITPIIASIRGEIYAREARGQQTPDEARWFDQYLRHALAAYAGQRSEDMNRETKARYPCEGRSAAIGAGPPLECPP